MKLEVENIRGKVKNKILLRKNKARQCLSMTDDESGHSGKWINHSTSLKKFCVTTTQQECGKK